jgi:hypothetical protein
MLVRVSVDCDHPARGDPTQPRLAKRITLRENCAQFCALSLLDLIANGSEGARVKIACTEAENQRDSKQSHSVIVAFGRSLNQRVGGSSPPPPDLTESSDFGTFCDPVSIHTESTSSCPGKLIAI